MIHYLNSLAISFQKAILSFNIFGVIPHLKFCYVFPLHLAGDDFIGGIQNITFPSVSEDEFDNISIACTEFVILEDKLAFEEVESFNVSLLPLELSEDVLAQFGENTTATVEIIDNDCKPLSLSLSLSLCLHKH